MSLTLQRILQSKVTPSLPRAVGRRFMANAPTATNKAFSPASTASATSSARQFFFSPTRFERVAKYGAAGLSLGAVLQYQFGSAENFFDEKFVTTKKPEDLADFYGTEDFMEVFCVLPFMVKLMMRNAEFDEEGTIHAWGLLGPGELEININFEEHEVDTDGDGEPDTIAWFNKKEHFCDVAPSFLGGFKLWEMTQNFGYHRYDDGTCVCYHHGEKFKGFFLVRLIFQLHAKYVIWATEKYINSPEFGSEDREEALQEQRHNIPLHVFKGFLAGLTREVERAQLQVKTTDTKKRQELATTLRRLQTISRNMEDETKSLSLPRLRTLRSHNTKVTHVHLMLDDQETKDTIQTAMKQIEASSGQRNGPTSEMQKLTRRTTLSLQKQREALDDTSSSN